LTSDGLFKVPDSVSLEEASFIELGIITLQGIRKARIRPGDRVAVVGQGLIGQLCNKLAKVLGAVEVIAVASSRSREKTALSNNGADRYISLKEQAENIQTIRADIVIEAVGSPNAIITASKCARDGGRVILLGSSRGLGRDVNWLELFQLRNISVIGAHISAIPDKDASIGRWTYRQEGELFFDLLSSGRLRVSDLITWRAKPEECNKVYEILAEGGREHVGIIFCWKQDEC
jgi:threonine dehydrogenase-like Zn-dependent dehydrogenase